MSSFLHEWCRIWSFISLFPSLGNIIYGDQANKEVLGHIWLIVGALNLWNHSVVILMEIHLLAERTPQHPPTPRAHTHTHTILWPVGKTCHSGEPSWKLPQDYVNYLSLYHKTDQGVLQFLDGPHRFTFVHNIFDMYSIILLTKSCRHDWKTWRNICTPDIRRWNQQRFKSSAWVYLMV